MHALLFFAFASAFAQPPANPFHAFHWPADEGRTVASISTTKSMLDETSAELSREMRALQSALETYAGEKWEKTVEEQTKEMKDLGVQYKQQEQSLRDIKALFAAAAANRTAISAQLKKQEEVWQETKERKRKLDGDATKAFQSVVEASKKLEAARAHLATVDDLMKTCPSLDASTERLEKARDSLLKATQQHADALYKMKTDKLEQNAETDNFKKLAEAFDSHNNFGNTYNTLIGEKRIRVTSLLEEAAVLRLRVGGRSRLRVSAKDRNIGDVSKNASSAIANAVKTIKSRAEEIDKQISALMSVKYGPNDLPTLKGSKERDVENMKKKIEEENKRYEAVKASDKKLQRKLDEQLRANQAAISEIARLIAIQERDIRNALDKGAATKVAVADVQRQIEDTMSRMNHCKQQAAEIAVQLQMVRCLEESKNLLAGDLEQAEKELEDAKTEASQAKGVAIEKAALLPNLHLSEKSLKPLREKREKLAQSLQEKIQNE